MSTPNIEQELAAINAIIGALDQLDEGGRQRVVRYVFDHLKLNFEQQSPREADTKESRHLRDETERIPLGEVPKRIVDIRTLREEKHPSTDVQMAAIVAYYLSELAPAALRKETITVADITEYFKQAGHPLPSEAKYTLTNARNAGYLDAAGNGQYKLNPVGHNLVAHKLPRAAESDPKKTRATRKPKKKVAKRTGKK